MSGEPPRAALPESFLFDIDGTLVDSRDVVEAAWSQVAALYGVDAAAVVTAYHGRRAAELAGGFFPGHDPAAIASRVERLEQEGADRVVALPRKSCSRVWKRGFAVAAAALGTECGREGDCGRRHAHRCRARARASRGRLAA